MGSGKTGKDKAASASTDSASKTNPYRLAGLGDTQGQAGDGRLLRSQRKNRRGEATEGVGELEQEIPRLEDAARNIWGAGNRGADRNVLRGTRRPLIRLAELLADGHYFLVNKRLRTLKLDYLKRSLVASLKVSYGLTRELERQIDITRKKSSKYAAADDVVPSRARSWRARRSQPKPPKTQSRQS